MTVLTKGASSCTRSALNYSLEKLGGSTLPPLSLESVPRSQRPRAPRHPPNCYVAGPLLTLGGRYSEALRLHRNTIRQLFWDVIVLQFRQAISLLISRFAKFSPAHFEALKICAPPLDGFCHTSGKVSPFRQPWGKFSYQFARISPANQLI